jgi:hypothetical protein
MLVIRYIRLTVRFFKIGRYVDIQSTMRTYRFWYTHTNFGGATGENSAVSGIPTQLHSTADIDISRVNCT